MEILSLTREQRHLLFFWAGVLTAALFFCKICWNFSCCWCRWLWPTPAHHWGLLPWRPPLCPWLWPCQGRETFFSLLSCAALLAAQNDTISPLTSSAPFLFPPVCLLSLMLPSPPPLSLPLFSLLSLFEDLFILEICWILKDKRFVDKS